MKPFARFVAFLLVVVTLSAAHAKVPPLLPVPDNLPAATRNHLDAMRAALGRRIDALRKWSADYNEKCGNRDLPRDDPRVADCLAEKAKLDQAGQEYTRDAEAFNARLLSLTSFGGIKEVHGDVRLITPDGRTLTGAALATAPLNLGTRIVTGPSASLKAVLRDNTVFSMGENGDLVVDDFIYDPNPSLERVVFGFAKGVCRWVGAHGGKPGLEALRVRTPAIVVGVRGTDFEITLHPETGGDVKLFSGALSLTNVKTGETAELTGGQRMTFGADGSWSAVQAMAADRPSV